MHGSLKEGDGDLDSSVYFHRKIQGGQSFLGRLFSKNHQNTKEMDDREKPLHEIETIIQNNIETLDYLRGISCLERDFVHLADKVIRTSLQLSHDCKSVNREALDSKKLIEKADSSWQHISQLGNILLSHVKHAKRYHLFYLEIENIGRRLDEIESYVDGLTVVQTPSEEAIYMLTSDIHQNLEFLVQTFYSWRHLSQQVHLVSPLHRRMPLCRGVHSGVLQTSISLPSTNGRPGHLHAGTRVQVRASQPADLLHREWFLVDREGLVVASVPAAFVWLESLDSSPERIVNNDFEEERSVRRSRSASDIHSVVNNFEIIEGLRKQIFRVWEKTCSKCDRVLRELSTSLLKNTPAEAGVMLNTDAIGRFNRALQKISELVEVMKYKDEFGTEQLVQFADKTRLKRTDHVDEGKGSTDTDVKTADAIVKAVDAFGEMVGCYRQYGSTKISDENEKNWVDMSEKIDIASKASTDSIQPITVPLQKSQPLTNQKSENVVVSQKRSSKTSEFLKSPKLKRHKQRHRSLTLDERGTDYTCPYSPVSSHENLQHSISLISRSSKDEKLPAEMHSQARSRRRDRFYNLLPILLRRHAHSRKKKSSKLSDDGESGFSDNDTSQTGPGIPSKVAEKPYDSLTLGRVNYTKFSDFVNPSRPPLLYSTSPFLNSTNKDIISTRDLAIQSEKYRKKGPLLYSVACQSGVCVSSGETEPPQTVLGEPIVRKLGKKMQVGRSFIAERHSTLVQGEGEQQEATQTEPTHVYANIDPDMIFPLSQSTFGPTLYEMGVQADLPNRLKGLKCQLEFEQPGVELGDRDQVSCEVYKERYDSTDAEPIREEPEFRTLSFRVAFNSQSTRCASTI